MRKGRSCAYRCLREVFPTRVRDVRYVPWRLVYALRRFRGSLAADEFIRRTLRDVPVFLSRGEYLGACVREAGNGLRLEFGVFGGESVNLVADVVRDLPDSQVFGFDSFEGLPEDWYRGLEKGWFRLDRLPAVRPNVTLVKGLFQDTLEGFLRTHPGRVGFLHVDSDLYSSAKFVLETLWAHDRIRPGTIIAFDEFTDYPNWEVDGEFKAFHEWIGDHAVDFEYFAYLAASGSVSVKIISISPERAPIPAPTPPTAAHR